MRIALLGGAVFRYLAIPDSYQVIDDFESQRAAMGNEEMVWACDSFWDCRGRERMLRAREEADKQNDVISKNTTCD